ncbi:MAG: hypothetical protein U1A78_25470 [Polyangia bacterium]
MTRGRRAALAAGLALVAAAGGPGPTPARAQDLLSFLSERDGNRQVYLIGADGRGERRLTAGPADDVNGPVTPDGRALLVTRGEGDAARGERRFRFLLFPLAPVGAAPQPLGPPRAALLNPSFLPDGRALLFESESEGLRDLFLLPLTPAPAATVTATATATGAGLRQLTRNREGNFQPDACARGGLVAFTSSRDRASELYRMRADGSDVRRLTYSIGSEWQPRCSADGRRVFFVSDRDGADRIYSVHSNGSEPRRASRRDLDPLVVEEQPALSPDGRRLAFVLRGPRLGARIHLVDLTTGVESELATPPDRRAGEPTWSRPGRPPRLAFTLSSPDPRARDTQIFVADPADRARPALKQVTTAPGPNWHPLFVH